MAKPKMSEENTELVRRELAQFPNTRLGYLWEKLVKDGYVGSRASFDQEVKKIREAGKAAPAATNGPWTSRRSGAGWWWIWNLTDGLLLSVANEKNFDRKIEWRIKTAYSTIMFQGEAATVEKAKEDAKAKARQFASDVLATLDTGEAGLT